jgi:hypothetical protein
MAGWPPLHTGRQVRTMKITNPPSPPFSLRPRVVSDPEGKGGLGGI